MSQVKHSNETMTKRETINNLVTSIREYQNQIKDYEGEICVALIELERLQAHIYLEYSSFVLFIFEEFGWSEVEYNLSKKLIRRFGIKWYKCLGRRALNPLLKVEEKSKEEEAVFKRISEYRKVYKNRYPTQATVRRYVHEVLGIKKKASVSKISDLREKYMAVLEENRELRETIKRLEADVGRLHHQREHRPAAQ